MERWVILNGQLVPHDHAKLHINDLGLRRGYGVFDFFRVSGGIPVFLEDHLQRFFDSAAMLELEVPYTHEQLEGFVSTLINLNRLQDAGIQMVLTGGYSQDLFTPGHPNLIVADIELRTYPAEVYRQGVKVITFPNFREIPTAKTTDYLVAVKLAKRMHQAGAAEVIYHDGKRVLEGARSSLFIIKNGVLITAREDVLPGITRKHALQVAQQLMPVEEREITLEEFLQADEILISSSTRGVMPVRQVDHQVIGSGVAGPYSMRWIEAFRAYQQHYMQSHPLRVVS